MRFEVLNASKDQEVYQAIQSGEVIEDDLTIIITVYQPNPDLWDEYRRRKL